MIVKAWGDWPLFQSLLGVLRSIGDRHGGASIANVATRWVLDHPCVGAVIIGKAQLPPVSFDTSDVSFCVGARLGITDHADDNQNVMSLRLDDSDRAAIEAILDQSNGRRLITTVGDCGAEYR